MILNVVYMMSYKISHPKGTLEVNSSENPQQKL
jgi:hypothetical protein